MAGLGDYKKGKAFTLKSGNKPTFKNMGSSPLSRRDVYIDGEYIGTGPEAVKQGIAQEKKNVKVPVGPTTEALEKGDLKEVTYTGDDVKERMSMTHGDEKKHMQKEYKETGKVSGRGSDRAQAAKEVAEMKKQEEEA